MATKQKDAVVKIDAKLLNNIETLLNKPKYQYKYVNKKQFIDIAVHELLQKEKEEKKT